MLVFALLVPVASARADEVAPDLERADLRVKAQAELRTLFGAMPSVDQKRLVGTYAAFDPSTSDPIAQVACDDDGDYVVVISDAMLRLLTHVARAASYDEATSSRRVDQYAAFVADAQVPGRRLLPPPPGFYATEKTGTTYEERLSDALSFVLARELAHLRAGDLACPKPTATKESGDDAWTSAEQRKAAEIAASVYRGTQAERDNEAIARVLDAGRSDKGGLALLHFFAQLKASPAVRFAPTYALHHPDSAVRATNVTRAAEAYEKAH